jgi:glutathionyl-hydroquinone reductase
MTMTQTDAQVVPPRVRYASPADPTVYGEYRINRDPQDLRPLYRFAKRLVKPGAGVSDSPGLLVADPGRFHLYSGWFCPWAQRATLVVALAGLADAVSVSYVAPARDARGWAFREVNGPDPVNGFTLLREAYEATEPGFDGHVSVPTLWDRRTHQVASNDYATLDADLATAFAEVSSTRVELYPQDLRDDIDELDRWLGPAVNHGVHQAGGDGEQARAARDGVASAFAALEGRLGGSRYLLGDRVTLADVRLFVTLVRYDVGVNAEGGVGPHLPELSNLWAYARDLYQQDAFRATTRLEAFTRPGADVPDWEQPSHRAPRTS